MKFIAFALLLVGSSIARAECMAPEAPDLPDGSVADLAAMVEGQKAVKTFVSASEAYLDCLTALGESRAEKELPEEMIARIEAHNTSIDEMEAVAKKFNEEIRVYKTKNK